jgi:hypothetical protein
MEPFNMDSKAIDLRITPYARQQLSAYIGESDTEISGFGIVEKGHTAYTVTKLYCPVQTCSGGDTEVGAAELSSLLGDVIAAGEDPANLRLWWHSHVNMQVFWSGTDNATATELARIAGGWFISIVGNKRGDLRTRVDLAHPFTMLWDELPLRIVIPVMPEVRAAIAEEVKIKVSKRIIIPPTTAYHYSSNERDGKEAARPPAGYDRRPYGMRWDFREGKFVPDDEMPANSAPGSGIVRPGVGFNAAGDVSLKELE